MPCYHPIKGIISYNGDKRKFVPKKITPPGEVTMEVPCGQCYGCRLSRSREWAIRIIKEQKCHQSNCFITLTYSNNNIPEHGTLSATTYTKTGKQIDSHFQTFMKDLRYHLSYKEPGMSRQYKKIKYFMCAEYGERLQRPHYHAILFNVSFEDSKLWKRTKSGELLYRSKTLEKLWTMGHSSIGTVTFESAAYVARYVTKKITGAKADEHYKIITNFSKETGEILATEQLVPEYATMSRNPGIGAEYYDKYKTDMFPSDTISILRNAETKSSQPPRYYTNRLKEENPTAYKVLKDARILKSQAMTEKGEYTKIRLAIKEKVKLAMTRNLYRHFEEFH